MLVVDALRARKRIAPYVRRTPLVESAWLSDRAGGRVSLKLESIQVSSSFKSRGAFNAAIAHRERGDTRPLVTASAGNHGRALAAAAETFGLALTVFTPRDAPQAKVAAIRRHGAILRAEARDYDEAERMAKAYAADGAAAFVSPYNDPDVIAGAATIAIELLEDAPALDTIVVPIGGGGLISGIAAVMKQSAPSVRIVGVEVERSCAFLTSRRAGRLVAIVPGETLADGLGGNPDPETITFGYVEQYVAEIVTVSEAALKAAVAGLVDREHVIAEGAGAAATAAVLSGAIDLAGRRAAAIVTGANIDPARLAPLLIP